MTESRKKANIKWDKANMTVVGCRITRTKAQEFKEACAALGTVPNQILQEAVNRIIAEAEKKKAGD